MKNLISLILLAGISPNLYATTLKNVRITSVSVDGEGIKLELSDKTICNGEILADDFDYNSFMAYHSLAKEEILIDLEIDQDCDIESFKINY